ncbi:MAG: urease accessory protein UreD [Vicinamibacterales bacterium]
MENALAATDESVAAKRATAGTGLLQVVDVGGRSVVSRAYATSPLRWLMPRNHGHAAWVYSSTFGGGLVDGDALNVQIEVGPAATALLATQASTKIYRSPRGTSSHLQAHVHAGACLVLLPDPVVPFAGARYRQSQQIDVAADASLIVVDWVSSGRVAHGERWLFERLRTSLRVRYDGRLVCHDAVTLDASDGALADRMGRFDVLATVVLMGPRCREAVEAILGAARADGPAPRADLYRAVAPLGASGALVRLAGRSVEQVGHSLRAALQFLPRLVGDDPWARTW